MTISYQVCDAGVMRSANAEEISQFEAMQVAAALPKVPQSVTSFQAKAALANANLYTSVNAYMNTSASIIDQLAWQEQITFNRSDSIISSLMSALNLSSEQLDSLFIAAADIHP